MNASHERATRTRNGDGGAAVQDRREDHDRQALSAGGTLEPLSAEMVRLQERFWGRGPDSATSYIVDDLLFIVMRGGLTVAEQTMLESGRQDSIRRTRQEFEKDMTGRLEAMVEQVTGRKVLTYQSQILFGPEIVIETFVFDRTGDVREVAQTAHGQLDDDVVGEVAGAPT